MTVATSVSIVKPAKCAPVPLDSRFRIEILTLWICKCQIVSVLPKQLNFIWGNISSPEWNLV